MSTVKFIHISDVHIGKDRLEGALPSQDFADAFNQVVDAAIGERVSFFLIAGDFFDKARIEPDHLAEGEVGLRRLAEAGIPVIAIEGNHDIVSSYDDRPSWLSYLNSVGLLRLLRTEFKEGKPIMKQWTEADRRGNWLDLAGVRIYGAGWFGASTARRLEIMGPLLEKNGFTILMLHAGINRMDEAFGMIDPERLAVIRDKVDYVALGHMHKRYEIDGYAYNAGALENWDLAEERHGDQKGYWLVEVSGGKFTPMPRTVRRRHVHAATFQCDGLTTLGDVLEGVIKSARSWPLAPESVAYVRLTGIPSFNVAEIDTKAVGAEIVSATGCKAAEVIAAFGRRPGESIEEASMVPRELIEAEEIEKLVRDTGRFEGRERLVRDMVRAVLTARTDEELYGELLQRTLQIMEGSDAHPEGEA